MNDLERARDAERQARESEVNKLAERVQDLIRNGKGRNDGVILADLQKCAFDLRARAASATPQEIHDFRESLGYAEDYDRGDHLP